MDLRQIGFLLGQHLRPTADFGHFSSWIFWTMDCQFDNRHSLMAPWHVNWRHEEIEISIFHSVSLTPRTLHLDWRIIFSVAFKILLFEQTCGTRFTFAVILSVKSAQLRHLLLSDPSCNFAVLPEHALIQGE
jgi:hypothetical protein